jgi:hypothetical protein
MLLLLVNGARNERNCYGYRGPSSKLSEAGDDLMVAHGAQRKPPSMSTKPAMDLHRGAPPRESWGTSVCLNQMNPL